MAFQAVPGVAQVTLHGRIDGQSTVNDLYFASAGGPFDIVELGELLDAVCTWYVSSIGSLASAAWTFVRGHIRDLDNIAGVSLDNSDHTAAGGVGGGAAPNNVSLAISFRTAIGGRSGRGRNYVPGIPLQAVSGNTITSDFIDNYVQGYSALLPGGGVLPSGWAWVVVSRVTGGAVRPFGIGIGVASVIVTDNVIDSMRNRLPGRGA